MHERRRSLPAAAKADEPAIDPAVRDTRDYRQGRDAFLDGVRIDSCPHRRGVSRTAWLCGYYDARTLDRLGHVFEKWNLSWP